MAVFNQMSSRQAGRPKRATGATQPKTRQNFQQQVVKPRQKQLQRAQLSGQQDELRQRFAQDLQQVQQVQQGGQPRQFAQAQPAQMIGPAAARFQQQNLAQAAPAAPALGPQAQQLLARAARADDRPRAMAPVPAGPAQIEAGRAAAARFQQQNQAPAQAMTGREQLGQQITGFLGSQLAQATRPGQHDQITQSQLVDFDEQTRRAREQQIEDLNRFGIIGGGGVSSGRVADILGRFDAETLRGRQAIKGAGLDRMLGTILPQAVQQARFAGSEAVEREKLAQTGGQFGESLEEKRAGRLQEAELERERMAQRGGEFAATLGETQAGRQQIASEAALDRAQQAAQFGGTLGETTAAREQAAALERERLGQQAQQFGQGQDLERDRLAQASSEAALDRGLRMGEFGATQEMEQARLAQQAEQFGQGQNLERQRLAQAASEAALDRGLRMGEFGATQDLERERLAQQAEQFDTVGEREAAARAEARSEAALDRGLRIGEFGATQEMEQARLAQQAQQFGEGQELERDRLAQAASEAALDRGLRMGEFGATQEMEQARLAQQAQLEADRLSQQAQQFEAMGDRESAALAQERSEAALDRGVRMGEISANILEQQAARAQQGEQFGLGQDLERERMKQQAEQFGSTTQMAQEQAKQDRDRLALSMLLGAQDDKQRKMLGYDDDAVAKEDTGRLMQSLGLRPSPSSLVSAQEAAQEPTVSGDELYGNFFANMDNMTPEQMAAWLERQNQPNPFA